MSWTVLGIDIDASAGHVSFIPIYTGAYHLFQAVTILPAMARKKNLRIQYPGLIDGNMKLTDHQWELILPCIKFNNTLPGMTVP